MTTEAIRLRERFCKLAESAPAFDAILIHVDDELSANDPDKAVTLDHLKATYCRTVAARIQRPVRGEISENDFTFGYSSYTYRHERGLRSVYYSADIEEFDRRIEMAIAGKLRAVGSHPEALDRFRELSLIAERVFELPNWMNTLFESSWSDGAKLPLESSRLIASPFPARREFPVLEFPYQQSFFSMGRTGSDEIDRCFRQWAKRLPGCYFSILRDVVECSIALCDRLNSEFSAFRSVSEWCSVLEISEDTFSRRRAGKAIPNYRVNPKSTRQSISIAMADLPPSLRGVCGECS